MTQQFGPSPLRSVYSAFWLTQRLHAYNEYLTRLYAFPNPREELIRMAMEKRGVTQDENESPPPGTKAAADKGCCGHPSSCGDDTLSKMADAAGGTTKKAVPDPSDDEDFAEGLISAKTMKDNPPKV